MVPNRVSVGMGIAMSMGILVPPPLVKRYFPQRVDTVSTLCLTLLQVGTTLWKTRPAERESTSRPLHRRAMTRPFAHGMLAILDKRRTG